TPIPAANSPGVRRANPPVATATGTATNAAIVIPVATAAPPGIIRDTRPPSRMYAAQHAPAASASSTPSASTPPVAHGAISAIPPAASNTHAPSTARRDPNTATPSGPMNSTVTARP